MMTLLGALILLLLGMLGARFAFPVGEFGTGPGVLFTARWHFLLIGFLLGPHAIGLLDPAFIGQLYPVLLLGIGWVGLLFGSQFSYRRLRGVSRRMFALLLLQAAIAFAVFAAVALAVMGAVAGGTPERRVMVLAAAASACVSGPLAIAIVSRAVSKGPVTEFILLAGSLDGVVGLVALAIVGAFYHPRQLVAELELFGPAAWLLIGLVLGLIFGLLFTFLTRRKPSNDQTVLYLLGLVLFLTGAAASLGVFAVFAAAVAGCLIANTSPYRRRVYDRLQEWVRPIYVILLVLMGALVDASSWVLLLLGLGYAVLRALAKIAGAWLARHVTRSAGELPATLGVGLIAQGGLSLILALSVAVAFGGLDATEPGPANTLLSTVALGVLLSDLSAPTLARRLLGRVGELQPARWLRRHFHRRAREGVGVGKRE